MGIYSEKLVEKIKIKNILKKLLPYQTEFQLIRLGDKNDGGYLIPDDLDGIKHCFTAGVGHTCNFEKELFYKYKIISTMIDPIIDETVTLPHNAKFINKKLSGFDDDHSISINNFIDKTGDIILKIDIEGEEYENLID